MKKILLFGILLFTINSNGQTLLEIAKALAGKTDDNTATIQKIMYKEVMNEVVTINSASNARFSGGSSRQGLKIMLPIGTTKWYYRITLQDAYGNYTYQPRENLFSMLTNNFPLFVNNQTDYGIDFYVIDDFSISNFRQTGNDNFRHYSSYSKEKTRGTWGECLLTQNNLWIGLRNYNMSQGLKAIVEVVAYGNY